MSSSIAADRRGSGPVLACVKWVDLRPEIDPLTGDCRPGHMSHGFSPADLAAVAVALGLGARWGRPVEVVCAGPPDADDGLRDLWTRRVDRVARIDAPAASSSSTIARELALFAAERDVTMVVCGEHSVDRGSGSVPALIAHHLDVAQVLGASEIEAADPSTVGGPDGRREVVAWRRLGGGRKERVRALVPAVVSVEAGAASLPRAALAAALSAPHVGVETVEPRQAFDLEIRARTARYRPRTRHVAVPLAPDAFGRIVELTGALVERTPPQVLRLDPADAADAILEAVRGWTSDD